MYFINVSNIKKCIKPLSIIYGEVYVNNNIILLVQRNYYYGIRIFPRRYDKYYIFILNKRFSILIFTTEHKIIFTNNLNHKNAVQIF